MLLTVTRPLFLNICIITYYKAIVWSLYNTHIYKDVAERITIRKKNMVIMGERLSYSGISPTNNYVHVNVHQTIFFKFNIGSYIVCQVLLYLSVMFRAFRVNCSSCPLWSSIFCDSTRFKQSSQYASSCTSFQPFSISCFGVLHLVFISFIHLRISDLFQVECMTTSVLCNTRGTIFNFDYFKRK